MKMVTTGLVIVIIGAVLMIVGALIYQNNTRKEFDKHLLEIKDMVVLKKDKEVPKTVNEVAIESLSVSHGKVSADWGGLLQNCLIIADYKSTQNPAISFMWNKIYGGRCVINSPTLSHCIVTELQEGNYIFEVTITCERYSLRQSLFVNVSKLIFN